MKKFSENLKNFCKKEKFNLIILTIIILLATLLRLYNFEEWFHFRADQTRDAVMASRVLNDGIGELRLLGPKAGGSGLHLGPVFYYFQAFSSWLFQSEEPVVMAYPDLLFSILTIPLLYFFLKNFFTNKTSFSISSIYAFSYVAVQYSRFAWNPNSLPFWSLLLIFSLYKIATTKNKKNAGWFLVLLALAYSVVSQLHFIALIGFPMVIFIFWLKYFPRKINWKFWLGAIFTVVILYSPVVASEIITKGNNSKHFLSTVQQRDNSKEKGFIKKSQKSFENYGKYYSYMVSSLNDEEVAPIYNIGTIFVLVSLFFIVLSLKKGSLKNKNFEKQIFLYLILSFFIGFAIVNYKLSHEINKPRYWFPQIFIPFVFLGFFLDMFFKSTKKYLRLLGWLLVFVFLVIHLTAIFNIYLNFSKKEDGEHFGRQTTSTTNRYHRIAPLSDMKNVSKYLYSNYDKSRKLCINAPGGYGAGYAYIFDLYYPEVDLRRTENNISSDLRENCEIFLITNEPKTKEKQIGILHMDFEVEDFYQSGAMEVYKVKPLDNEVSRNITLEDEEEARESAKEKLEESREKDKKEVEVLPMKVWRNFFERNDL